jgi:hypothetical protein
MVRAAVFGFGGLGGEVVRVERRKADFSTALRSGRNDDVWVPWLWGRNDDVWFLREATRDIWLRLPPGIAMDYSLL